MPVTIRPLAAGDEARWRVLWQGYLTFYDSTVAETVTALTFARLIDPARTQQAGLVAEAGGQIVGFVHMIWHAHNWRAEDVCYLQDLFVDPAARGTGAGRALIEAVYAEADDRGTPAVYWLTQERNAAARQLYDRVGTLTPFIKYQR